MGFIRRKKNGFQSNGSKLVVPGVNGINFVGSAAQDQNKNLVKLQNLFSSLDVSEQLQQVFPIPTPSPTSTIPIINPSPTPSLSFSGITPTPTLTNTVTPTSSNIGVSPTPTPTNTVTPTVTPISCVVYFIGLTGDTGTCDGVLQIGASGGTPPYVYYNNTSSQYNTTGLFTGLCGDITYEVYIDDNVGCVSNPDFIYLPSSS